MVKRLLVALSLALPLSFSSAVAEEIRVIAWNVEDTGSNPNANKARLRQLAEQRSDLWGLSEVRSDNFDEYLDAVNPRHRFL